MVNGLESGRSKELAVSDLSRIELLEGNRMDIGRGSRTIVVTGGKGGTGKTTVAVNLSFYFHQIGKKVLLADCDVDAPSVATLLGAEMRDGKEVRQFLPIFDESKCVRCGECSKACRMHAILQVPDKTPLLFPDLCLGCGACAIVCPTDAILDGRKVVGWIYEAEAYGVDLLIGELKLNERKSEAIIREVKERAMDLSKERRYDVVIIDTAPGAHCDVALSLKGSDFVLAVTEPTPFGIHDLDLVLELANMMKLKHAVVVNRADLPGNHHLLKEVCEKHTSRIIGEIPVDDNVVKSHVRSRPLMLDFPNSPAARAILKLARKIGEELGI